MAWPVIQGEIDRRILVNYRIAPEVAAAILPPPFQPLTVRGWAVGGICLIRLRRLRPRFVPAVLGLGSENMAHRFAVQFPRRGEHRTGVYIPRRDTSSQLTAWAGGRIFPGQHHRAEFRTAEADGHYRIEVVSRDGAVRVLVEAEDTDCLPAGSIFHSLQEVSAFFEQGSCGYSCTAIPGQYDGLELRTFGWAVRPFHLRRVESSVFDDPARFPPGSIQLDCGLLMSRIQHQWHPLGVLASPPRATAAAPVCRPGLSPV